MEIIDYDVVHFPDWALALHYNSDPTGVENPEDAQLVADWEEKMNAHTKTIGARTWGMALMDMVPSFCTTPAFGLPCACYEAKISWLK